MKSLAILLGLIPILVCAQLQAGGTGSVSGAGRTTKLVQLLDIYGDLTGRTVLHSGELVNRKLRGDFALPADTNRAIALIEGEFRNLGFDLITSEIFVRVLPVDRTNSPLATQLAAIGPAPAHDSGCATNTINFPSLYLDDFLSVYPEMADRNVIHSSRLSSVPIGLHTRRSLTAAELCYAFDTVLALDGIAVVRDGEKFLQIVMLADRDRIRAEAPNPGHEGSLISPEKIPVFSSQTRPGMTRPPPAPGFGTKVTAFFRTVSRKLFGPPKPPPPPTADSLVAYYAKLTGKKAVTSPKAGKMPVEFRIIKSVTKEELLYAIETTLRINGLAIVPVDKNGIQAGYAHELERRPAKATKR